MLVCGERWKGHGRGEEESPKAGGWTAPGHGPTRDGGERPHVRTPKAKTKTAFAPLCVPSVFFLFRLCVRQGLSAPFSYRSGAFLGSRGGMEAATKKGGGGGTANDKGERACQPQTHPPRCAWEWGCPMKQVPFWSVRHHPTTPCRNPRHQECVGERIEQGNSVGRRPPRLTFGMSFLFSPEPTTKPLGRGGGRRGGANAMGVICRSGPSSLNSLSST